MATLQDVFNLKRLGNELGVRVTVMAFLSDNNTGTVAAMVHGHDEQLTVEINESNYAGELLSFVFKVRGEICKQAESSLLNWYDYTTITYGTDTEGAAWMNVVIDSFEAYIERNYHVRICQIRVANHGRYVKVWKAESGVEELDLRLLLKEDEILYSQPLSSFVGLLNSMLECNYTYYGKETCFDEDDGYC